MRTEPTRKGKYDWKRYNRSLAKRGSLTLYIGNDMERKWTQEDAGSGSPGRPIVYPQAVIMLALVLQQVYRLPLRQTHGLIRSILGIAGLELPVPDPSTLCRRRAALDLPAWPKAGACIVIDSTGLQIRGPNTWLTTVHGLQRRTYRKIHLCVDPDTSLIVAGSVTPCQTHDSEALDSTLGSASCLDATQEVIGDGAYDRRICYRAARKRKLRLITPPGQRAVIRPEAGLVARNRAIEECRFLGKANWKVSVRNHRRSLAESAMHRLKAAFGPGLRSRKWCNQRHEALLRAHILNSWCTQKRHTQS